MRRVVLTSVLFAFVASPAMADLSFSFDNLRKNPGGISSAYTASNSLGNVTLDASTATFNWFTNPAGSFNLTLSAYGVVGPVITGTFTIKDTDVDTITGSVVSGAWTKPLPSMWVFSGILTNVVPNPLSDILVNGHSGSVYLPMLGEPWTGSIGVFTFNSGSTYSASGSFNAVPIPAAVVIGMLGLGVAGLKLRKYA